jgi:hypothetical protein
LHPADVSVLHQQLILGDLSKPKFSARNDDECGRGLTVATALSTW